MGILEVLLISSTRLGGKKHLFYKSQFSHLISENDTTCYIYLKG